MNTTITDSQISKLQSEAAAAGDYAQTEICRLALDGVQWAIEACAAVIADTLTQDDEEE